MQEFPLRYAKRALLASLMISSMGMTVLFPVLAPLGRQIGLGEFQITSIIAASSLTVFMVTPIWGRMSDRWGRKRVMMIGLFGFAAGTSLFNTVLYTGMTGLLTGTVLYVALIVARVMHATVFSATMPASNAYMADITDIGTRTKGMAASGAASNIGAILGPTLTGLAVISMLMPMWVVAAAACINGLFVWRFLPEPPRQWVMGGPSRRMRYTEPRIFPFVIVGVTMFMGFAIVQQTMGFRFEDALGLTASETASVFGVAMMCSAGASLVSQTIIVQRFDIAPFTLLKLAIPMMIIAFTMM
ncbi:MAG TPA: MFS transporter, partial [Pseudomonadales bacterium]|nr:MFS transporter [Pseudomonadales bacterium]